MKHKKIFCVALASVLTLSMAMFAACGDDSGNGGGNTNPGGTNPGGTTEPGGTNPPAATETLVPTEEYSFPLIGDRTTDVRVHDPSIFYDEASKTYYAFGTHFAVASSKNLVNWTQEVNDNEWQKLYGNNVGSWRTVLSQACEHAGGTMPSTWAPDVNYYNGKYYMYVSVTNSFGSSRSAISRVEADNVMGPYSNETLIVTSDDSHKSNAIDPELFYDKDGGLWMVYGSTYGGIFIVELENSGANWGLPKDTAEEGQPLGKNIWATGNNVEGPFVFYNELTDYYYLMTSYGALMYSYNMRIARSKNPDGPYEDVTGQKMTDVVKDSGQGGNKVAGSFKFAELGSENGYAAMGHNSVVKDAQGRYFVVYHARRQSKFNGNDKDHAGVTEGHTLNVSQLYFNEEGWPVMSPVAYVGEKAGLISQADAAGEYDIVIHTTGITAEPVASTKYTLTEEGKVMSGTTEAGTWTVKQNYYVEITIAGITYKGVIVPGWDMYSPAVDQLPVFAITAVASLTEEKQGGSLWAISPRA